MAGQWELPGIANSFVSLGSCESSILPNFFRVRGILPNSFILKISQISTETRFAEIHLRLPLSRRRLPSERDELYSFDMVVELRGSRVVILAPKS